MTSLDATFQSNGRAANIVEPGDVVDIVFTAPPQSATNVQVQIIEAPGQGDAVTSDRLIATFSGFISGGKFQLDTDNGDPLNINPQPNPLIGNFSHSTFPPKFSVRFKDNPSKQFDLLLPDVENENGAYEIKLKVTGAVSGSSVTFTGTAILQLRVWFDVMIVPDVASANATQKKSGEFQLFQDNVTFSSQWRKYAGARRQVVTIPIDGAIADFERVVTAAAPKAKKGDLILFVGHGGAGGFRGLMFSMFDTTPSSQHGSHPNAITSDVLNLPNIATRDNSGRWIANDKVATKAQSEVDALAPRYDALVRLGPILKQNQVGRFIVLSCNMGKDANFGFKLSKLLQITVCGYQSLVVSNQVVFTNPSQTLVEIWLLSGDAPPTDGSQDPNQPPGNDPNNPPFHEIPTNVRTFAP